MPGRRRPFLRNVAILTAGGLIERILGALYRVALARAAGPVALGLIQFVLPILRLCLILGTLGLPQALGRMIAESLARHRRDEAHAAFGWSLKTVAIAGGGLAVLLVSLAPVGRMLFPDARVVPLLRWLAPILVCDSLSQVIQASFQGHNRMWPIVGAGLLGQGVKLVLCLVLLARTAARGAGFVAGTALGIVAFSEAVSLFFLLAVHGRPALDSAAESRALLRSSLPLMGDGLVFAVAGAVDMLVIPRRLVRAGLARAAITPLMGEVWGMALPSIFLPMVIVWPIAYATMPVLAAAAARGDIAALRRRAALAYLAVLSVAAGATVLFLFFARPVVSVLYAHPAAARYLRQMAWAVVPIYLASIGGTILVGLNLSSLLFRQSLFCAVLRCFLIYVLTGLPRLGVTGAIIGIVAGNGLLALVNGWSILRRCRAGRPAYRASGTLPG